MVGQGGYTEGKRRTDRIAWRMRHRSKGTGVSWMTLEMPGVSKVVGREAIWRWKTLEEAQVCREGHEFSWVM